MKFKYGTYLNQVSGEEFLKSNLPAWAHETFQDADGTQIPRFIAELFKAGGGDEESGVDLERSCRDAEVCRIGNDLSSSQRILGEGNLVIVVKESPQALLLRAAEAATVASPLDRANSHDSLEHAGGPSATSSGTSSEFSSTCGSSDRSSSSCKDSGDVNSDNSDCSGGKLHQLSPTPNSPFSARVPLPDGILGALVRTSQTMCQRKKVRGVCTGVWAGKQEVLLCSFLRLQPGVALGVQHSAPRTIPRPLVHLCLPARSLGTSLQSDFVRQRCEGEIFLEGVCSGVFALQLEVVGHPLRVMLGDLHINSPTSNTIDDASLVSYQSSFSRDAEL